MQRRVGVYLVPAVTVTRMASVNVARSGQRLACHLLSYKPLVGWSSVAIGLGKFLMPGSPTNFDNSRARAYCAFSRYGCGMFWTYFFSSLSCLSPFSLSLRDGPI